MLNYFAGPIEISTGETITILTLAALSLVTIMVSIVFVFKSLKNNQANAQETSLIEKSILLHGKKMPAATKMLRILSVISIYVLSFSGFVETPSILLWLLLLTLMYLSVYITNKNRMLRITILYRDAKFYRFLFFVSSLTNFFVMVTENSKHKTAFLYFIFFLLPV